MGDCHGRLRFKRVDLDSYSTCRVSIGAFRWTSTYQAAPIALKLLYGLMRLQDVISARRHPLTSLNQTAMFIASSL